MPRSITLLLLSGVGCAPFAQMENYYENWDPPTIEGLSSTSEAGNIGGGTLTIEGSGFGEDADQLVVVFGDDNAEILSVSDSEIEVRVPPGPISGGAVDVRVATATGTAMAEGAYTYDVGEHFDEQIGHIQINNFWESCLGGLSDRLDDTYGAIGCNEIAYLGYTGIDGLAETLSFRYPRLHAENIGFFGGSDQAGSDWVVERPGQVNFVFGVEDLHADIGEVVLTNELWKGDYWCPDLDGQASYRYGGGVEGYLDPVSVSPSSYLDGSSCEEGEPGAVPMSELHFCMAPSEDGVPSYVYRADWTVSKNFFAGKKNDHTKKGTIVLEAKEVGIEGLELDVPESLIVYNTEGFEPALTDAEAADDLWAITAFQGCFDDTGASETLDDVALRFEWTPSSVSEDDGTFDCDEAGELCAQHTYVRLTLTALSLNWFGTVDYPIRATIVAEDKAARGSDLASIEVPASIMYQIPTVRLPQAGGLTGSGLLDSTQSDWGYVVTTFERVTDYTVRTSSGDTVVFSYTTGDFGFFGWDNPTEADGCHNCLDDDNDGWSDADDPDCAGGTEEVGYGDDPCNDNIDNDGDGRRDSLDAECESGDDSDESDCSNGDDDDGDGLTDDEDPGCAGGGNEGDADLAGNCEDGIDGDSDGWTDTLDPDCATGTEELGYGSTVCNDGADNDGDSLPDAADTDCVDAYDGDESSGSGVSNCTDGIDGDSDGWTDTLDPDCATGTEELGYGSTVCNDGVDNDGDSLPDAADTDCVDAYDGDESSGSGVSNCADGIDGDSDGWTDTLDPDCATGTEELGYGSTGCNDGVDNDGDSLPDAADTGCVDAYDTDEE
jgi:hypothetical protein